MLSELPSKPLEFQGFNCALSNIAYSSAFFWKGETKEKTKLQIKDWWFCSLSSAPT